MGIVDFLQDWTMKKKIERLFKIYILRKDPDGLSVMLPEPYKLRFQRKLDQIFDIDDNSLHEATSLLKESSKGELSPKRSKHNKSVKIETFNPLVHINDVTSEIKVKKEVVASKNQMVIEDYVSIDHFDEEDL